MNDAVVVDADQTAKGEGAEGENTGERRQVAYWQGCIEAAKENTKIKDAFERMRENMKFARGLQWPDQDKLHDSRYVVNIVQRHLRQREAALYAKNPTAVAKRRQTLDFQMWEGDLQTVMQAQQQVMQTQQQLVRLQQLAQQAAVAGDQPAVLQVQQQMAQVQRQMMQPQQLLQDYQRGMQRRQQLETMAKTLEIVWSHQVGEQQPPFKKSMKQLVRRVLTTGVGYLKLGYHRFGSMRPEDVDRVTDLTEQVSALQQKMAELTENDEGYDETSRELADVEDLLQKVTEQEDGFIREGLDFDFPRSTSLIVDPGCYQLDGFLGAGWVAQEWALAPDKIEQIYKVRLGDKFTPYDDAGNEVKGEENLQKIFETEGPRDCKALVWEVWNKTTGQMFSICQGHPDFLEAPAEPAVKLERFWPFFVLMFNGLEDEDELFPPSDVDLLRDPQTERNLMRQRLREHRDAARPGHVAPTGRLDEQDKGRLQRRQAHEVIEINGLAEQEDVRRILQPIPTNPIDPNQYETGTIEDDIYKAVGTSEAVVGGSSGGTATEASIGESSRLSAIGSNVDDLDDFLTEIAKSGSHLLLMEMSTEKVREIAGPGAVWPELTAGEVAKDLWLEVRAGSSGRPNKAAEIQNFERVVPFLLQIPGIRPERLLREALDRLDDRLEVEDFYDANLPSIMSMNRQSQVGTGDAATDPNQQGGEGGDRNSLQQGDTNMGPRAPAENRNMDPNRPQ